MQVQDWTPIILNKSSKPTAKIIQKKVKMPELKSNALDIHESHISHVPIEQACRVSLLTELIWHPGDLLWWDSHLLHTSNNFIKNGYTSKQGIIIHTYV